MQCKEFIESGKRTPAHSNEVKKNELLRKRSFPLRISSVNVTPADLVTFTEEILNGKLHFLCSVRLLLKYLFLRMPSLIRFNTSILTQENLTSQLC